MNQIRNRLLLIHAFTLLGVSTFSILAVMSFRQQTRLTNNLSESAILQDQIRLLAAKRPTTENLNRLKELTSKLQPAYRSESAAKVLLSIQEQRESTIRSSLQTYEKNEIEYRAYLNRLTQFLNLRVQYYAIIAIGIMLLGIFSGWMYIHSTIFSPIRLLAHRMYEFLSNRYSYEFVQPLPDEIGHLHGTFNVMAQRVLQNMRELTTLDQAKSEFLSIASHELRTPLTSIKGSLSLLRSGIAGTLNDEASQLLAIAEIETDRLIRLINDLLDLAKIEAGRFPLHPQWTSAQKLSDVTLQSLNGFAEQAHVKLASRVENAFEIYIDGDRIQQVLTNLISNAIKFSPQNSTVEVAFVLDSNQHVCVEVHDQGRGIAPDDQELIFQKFRQATSESNPLVKGTGLGLAIAKALVEEHGGEIGVRSVVGQGSTFYFTLPHWRLGTVEHPKTQLRSA